MKRTLLNIIYCLGCYLLMSADLVAKEACLLMPITLEQRVDRSTLIAEGRVVAQESFWDDRHQRIYTSNIVEVYKIFKGNVAGDRVEIVTEGGTVGNAKHVHTATLSLTMGQAGIFFGMPHALKGSDAGFGGASYMVYSSLQGFIQYDLSIGTASAPFDAYQKISHAREAVAHATKANYRVIKPEPKELELAEQGRVKNKTTAVPVILSFLPLSAPGGTGALLTITGANFGLVQGSGFVEFPNANDGGATYVKPVAADYITWTDNQIVVRVPSTVVNPAGCAGTGNFRVTNSDPNTGISPAAFTVTYTWSNINDGGVGVRADLVNDNGTGGYTFQSGPTFSTNAPATAAFLRAMKSWCPTQVNWIGGANTATNVAASDGINIVRFDIGAELPAGNLGRLTSYYSGCGPVGGPFTWFVNEMDVVFDDGANWQYGPALPTISQSDFESVALHELGHGLQLNHVISTAEVMHYNITTGQTRRQLSVDDLTGGSNVTATSILPNVCGSTPMILLPCPLPVQLLSFEGKVVAEKGASLEWVVTDQVDIQGYDVERSPDGVRFEKIAYLESDQAGGGTYNYLDEDFANEAFYRLIITETNGSIKSTNVVHLREKGLAGGIAIFPNPARNGLKIVNNGVDLTNAVLVITAADGRLVREQTLTPGQSGGMEAIGIDDMSPGMYFYKVETESKTFSGRFIKQ